MKTNSIWSRFTKLRNQLRTIIKIFRKVSIKPVYSVNNTPWNIHKMRYICLNLINAIKDMWNKIEEISKRGTKSKYTT